MKGIILICLGAVNPRDNDLHITEEGDHLVFNGFKNFNTGGVVSDLTVLEGVFTGTEHHIFAIVPTAQPGMEFAVSPPTASLKTLSLKNNSTTGIILVSALPSPAVSRSTKSKSHGPTL